MARTAARTSGGRGALRALVLTLAVLLAAGATAAVVLTEDPRSLRLAVLGALWAFILAALAAPRRRSGDEEDGGAAPAGLPAGKELELRRTYEVELEREVAARREYELQLEVYLRREVEQGLVEDVRGLREEITRMRGEMMDRLDGELRMERIETTRLIGGSLRALQDEARRLGIGLRVPEPLAEPSLGGREPGRELLGLPAADLNGYPTDAVPVPGQPGTQAAQPYSAVPAYARPAGQPGYRSAAGTDSGYGGAAVPPEPAYPTAPPEPGPLDAYLAGGQPLDPPAAPSRADEFGPILGGPLPEPPPPSPRQPSPSPPSPRPPQAGESVPRRRRARGDGEDNEVLSRLLGR